MSKEVRIKQRFLKDENKKWSNRAAIVPYENWPASFKLLAKSPIEVWRSNKFLIQVFQENLEIIRLTVCRTEIDALGAWRDGISWDELQQIKSECGYGMRDAVEIYPDDKSKVNVANMRHLWVMALPLPFAWRNFSSSGARLNNAQ